jgi:hypothetical protein
MKSIARSIVVLLMGICIFSAAGCAGYRLGSSLPEGLQKVYVPTFVNQCGEPLIENDTTQYAIAEIQKDGALQIASDFADADAELTVTITRYSHEAIRFDRDNPKQADEYRLKLTAEIVFEQIKPEKKILVRRTVVGEGTFVSSGDMASAKRAALPSTSADLAHRIVESIVEYW